MDFTKLAVADTAALHLKGADGNFLYDGKEPIRIILFSPGSKEFGVVEERQTNRAVKRMQDNDGKVSVPPANQRAAEVADDLAAITAGFEHIEYDGKTGQDLYRAVYADPKLGYIARQVQKFVADWGNFTPG